jgi:hypothetical protein
MSRHAVACDEEVAAKTYWIQTLSPWLVSLSSELALLQPADPASLARARCAGAAEWSGACRAAADAYDAASSAAYMSAVGQPFLEALAAAVIKEGSLPEDPGAAAAPLLAEGGALAAGGAEAAAALGAGFAHRTVPRLGEASALLRGALASAAAWEGEHGGAGVELEPVVPRHELEAHIRACQPR